ncbi:MAG: aminotransferase class V-fold PLP-dependent enzyme [Chloroflexi bacterium]|nr:aminotransferase class V-fold PLP-dependent enzyme [Chloroflexota bacterium]
MGIHDTSQWYRKLGVRPIINAFSHNTMRGGSLMPPDVVAAMADAAQQFAYMPELMDKAGRFLAAQIGVPGVFISNGAAACLAVSAAAALAGADPARARRLPHVDWGRDELIIPRSHRFGYDQAYELTGGRFVEVGDDGGATLDQFAAAMSAKTAGVMLLGNPRIASRCTLEEVVALARPRGVAVIVDAASELPPMSNLRLFIDQGADMVIFSGGKGIHGPQQTGMILCRTEDWLRACAVNGSPNSAVGRPMKVAKEEIVGLCAAVERYVRLDHDAEDHRQRAVCAEVMAGLAGLPGIRAEQIEGLSGANGTRWAPGAHPLPIVAITVDPVQAGLTAAQLNAHLLDGDPAIHMWQGGAEIWMNPQTVCDGEGAIIAARIRAEVGAARTTQPAAAP